MVGRIFSSSTSFDRITEDKKGSENLNWSWISTLSRQKNIRLLTRERVKQASTTSQWVKTNIIINEKGNEEYITCNVKHLSKTDIYSHASRVCLNCTCAKLMSALGLSEASAIYVVNWRVCTCASNETNAQIQKAPSGNCLYPYPYPLHRWKLRSLSEFLIERSLGPALLTLTINKNEPAR